MFFVHAFNWIRCLILVSKLEKYISYYGNFRFWTFQDFLHEKRIRVNLYSFVFVRNHGIYVYSRVNGRIYFFES